MAYHNPITRRRLLQGTILGGGSAALGAPLMLAAPHVRAHNIGWPESKKKVRVRDLDMAYYEVGAGDPIIFLHGNPTSSYLWRNVIPHVQHLGRCIAPDMIGMGDSDPLPDSDRGAYKFATHRDYLFALFEAIGAINNVTLVIHDWGSGVGLAYGERYPERVKGIAYMEAILRPSALPLPAEPTQGIFSVFRSDRGEPAILDNNVFVEQILIGGLGYGGWSVLQEVQRVRLAPVDEAPVVAADLDPLAGVTPLGQREETGETTEETAEQAAPFDRIYRPQALDVPVLTPRDGAIATLDPDRPDRFGPPLPEPGANASRVTIARVDDVTESIDDMAEQIAASVQVTARPPEEVVLFAVETAWVRVRSSGGTTLFERVMEPGESYTIPVSEEPATLRTGNAGGVFFMVGGTAMGPAGTRGQITDGVALAAADINTEFQAADLDAAPAVVEYVELILAGEATELNPLAAE